MLSQEKGQNDSLKVDEELPSSTLFMDQRVPYNMENVMSTLLRIMVARGMLSLNDARRIMKSGESYLH
jgi:hypothetical protein